MSEEAFWTQFAADTMGALVGGTERYQHSALLPSKVLVQLTEICEAGVADLLVVSVAAARAAAGAYNDPLTTAVSSTSTTNQRR